MDRPDFMYDPNSIQFGDELNSPSQFTSYTDALAHTAYTFPQNSYPATLSPTFGDFPTTGFLAHDSDHEDAHTYGYGPLTPGQADDFMLSQSAFSMTRTSSGDLSSGSKPRGPQTTKLSNMCTMDNNPFKPDPSISPIDFAQISPTFSTIPTDHLVFFKDPDVRSPPTFPGDIASLQLFPQEYNLPPSHFTPPESPVDAFSPRSVEELEEQRVCTSSPDKFFRGPDMESASSPDGEGAMSPARRIKLDSETARDHALYRDAMPSADGLYHCPWEGTSDCNHKAEKLKCNYDPRVRKSNKAAAAAAAADAAAAAAAAEAEAIRVKDEEWLTDYTELEEIIRGLNKRTETMNPDQIRVAQKKLEKMASSLQMNMVTSIKSTSNTNTRRSLQGTAE
ncbi:hypothetical protein CFO_g540 [Ceratocystis platani]|uniref:Uncharacterized protein n=1 Tax=Ceratocystis fimbriata f. sp. platani TaxID=88771 RepID=A0A0F8B529_CERFI|nr:hypothetical protein CFO_g540 [Ceratocystis platani]